LLAVVFCNVVLAFSDRELFAVWKLKYGKKYSEESEENKRFSIFQSNLRFIESHPRTTFTVAMNQFGDLTAAEFGAHYARARGRSAATATVTWDGVKEYAASTPASWDWRTKGVIGPVLNQGEDGEVLPFVITDNLNSMIAINNSKPVTTSCSIANLIDCVSMQTLEAMFNYATKQGVDTTASYPTSKGMCAWNSKTLCVKLAGYQNMSSEAVAKVMLYQHGPMTASFDAQESSFQFYEDGVYSAKCSPVQLDFALLLVGYGVQGSTDYWIAQNSWGSDWGMQGYAYIQRGSNTCGIMSDTLLPVMP